MIFSLQARQATKLEIFKSLREILPGFAVGLALILTTAHILV